MTPDGRLKRFGSLRVRSDEREERAVMDMQSAGASDEPEMASATERRQLGTLDVFAAAIDLYLADLPRWIAVVGTLAVPLIVASALLPSKSALDGLLEILSVVPAGAITVAMAKRLQGERMGVRGSYAAARSRLGSLVGANFVVGFVLTLIVVLGVFLGVLFGGARSLVPLVAAVVGTAAMVLLILVRYGITNQVVMIEGLGFRAATGRSSRLVSPQIHLATPVMILLIVLLGPAIAFGLIAGFALGWPDALAGVVGGLVWSVGAPLVTAVLTILHAELRARSGDPLAGPDPALAIPSRPRGLRLGSIGFIFAVGVVLGAVSLKGLAGQVGTRGVVAFGTGPGADGCSVAGETRVLGAGGSVYWSATLERQIAPPDSVTLSVSQDGNEVASNATTVMQTADCLSGGGPVGPLDPGTYVLSLTDADGRLATGRLVVR